MSNVNLVWVTPNVDALIAHMARVSNPEGQARGDRAEKLIAYMAREGHWSPFDMVDACLEITTERDVGRQLLRHQTFKFQEFSQRYADPNVLGDPLYRPARLQDAKNRQNSLPCDDPELAEWWDEAQRTVRSHAKALYARAVSKGIAKELARGLLPEGQTPTRLYMKGTVRSWWFFVRNRTHPSAQLETRRVAEQCEVLLRQVMPVTWAALETHA
jgi:thymidylate synthase (FAD)